MNEIYSRILNAGNVPSRQDIADLLASVGKPGEKREEKRQVVQHLFEEGGWKSTNFQGHSLFDDIERELTGYEAY